MKRLNITIPENLAREIAIFPNKSRFISDAIEERLKRMKKKELEKLLAEGYKKSRCEDNEVNKEWEEITLEGWRK